MQKLQKHTTTQDGMPIVAKTLARYVRCSPRKLRFVADEIRYKTAGEALELLDFTHRPSAVPHLRKALVAAMNAAKDYYPEPSELVIGELIINDAPMMKRIRAASMGRAVRIRKRQSHIFLALTAQ